MNLLATFGRYSVVLFHLQKARRPTNSSILGFRMGDNGLAFSPRSILSSSYALTVSILCGSNDARQSQRDS